MWVRPCGFMFFLALQTRELTEKHTKKDQQLYDAALDIFWRRVAVMEEVVGERFHDLPGKSN